MSEVQSKEEFYRRCPGFRAVDVENLGYKAMVLKGELKISLFGGALLLFDFEDCFEAERVLARGSQRFLGHSLQLTR